MIHVTAIHVHAIGSKFYCLELLLAWYSCWVSRAWNIINASFRINAEVCQAQCTRMHVYRNAKFTERRA